MYVHYAYIMHVCKWTELYKVNAFIIMCDVNV